MSGFSEVESKTSVLSEVNRKVKAKGLTTNNLEAKPANQRQQKPQAKKGKSNPLVINLNFIIKVKLTEEEINSLDQEETYCTL